MNPREETADEAASARPAEGRNAGGGLLTPSKVRALLAAHGLAPSKRHGQNFVVDANTVRKTVREAGVRPGDLVVEIGPGLGSLTLALRQVGAEVIAIEIDRGLAAAVADVVDASVRILHADALTVDYGDLLDRPARLVANLPYNVATPLVVTALESGAFFALHVMVQREVGERWCAAVRDPRFGGVSVKIAAMAEASVVSTVSRAAFWPVPNVDSVTVALRPRADPMPAGARRALFDLIDAGFSQRRKRLRNSLATAGWQPADTEAALAEIGHDPGVRAEDLGLADWLALCEALTGRSHDVG